MLMVWERVNVKIPTIGHNDKKVQTKDKQRDQMQAGTAQVFSSLIRMANENVR